jgi:hypothetical protein
MYPAVDSGDFGALILLELSAAFDTVDHDILLQLLQSTFWINGITRKWFRSYLIGSSQYVRFGSSVS